VEEYLCRAAKQTGLDIFLFLSFFSIWLRSEIALDNVSEQDMTDNSKQG